MTMVFHGPDDQHAPFPHRIVIIPSRTVLVREPVSRKTRKVTYPKQEFVICSYCDHWIQRTIPACDCPYQCHGIEDILAELTPDDVYSNQEGTQVPVREAAS